MHTESMHPCNRAVLWRGRSNLHQWHISTSREPATPQCSQIIHSTGNRRIHYEKLHTSASRHRRSLSTFTKNPCAGASVQITGELRPSVARWVLNWISFVPISCLGELGFTHIHTSLPVVSIGLFKTMQSSDPPNRSIPSRFFSVVAVALNTSLAGLGSSPSGPGSLVRRPCRWLTTILSTASFVRQTKDPVVSLEP